jgi:arabinofuranan 3-O-arabinosyltransferase
VGELSLPPATVATPLNGGDITGSVCGFGPVVTVDGRSYRTQVRGFIGDIVSAGPLRFESCSGPIRLPAGEHRMRIASTEQFQPVKALLRSPEGPTADGAGRPLGTVTGTATRQEARIGPGPEAILSTTRNLNRGWTATLDGRPLDPMVSDGWAQAWRVPAGAGGDLVISYAPQRAYLVSLYGGMAVAALVLLLAIVMLFRTRLRPVRPIPERVAPTPRRWVWWALVVLAVPVAWVLGGVPAAAAVAVGAVVRRPQVLRVMAAVLLVAAPALVAWELRDGPQLRFDTADLLAGGGFVLALMSIVPRPRRTPAAVES